MKISNEEKNNLPKKEIDEIEQKGEGEVDTRISFLKSMNKSLFGTQKDESLNKETEISVLESLLGENDCQS